MLPVNEQRRLAALAMTQRLPAEVPHGREKRSRSVPGAPATRRWHPVKTRTRLAVVENVVHIARSPEDVFDYCVDLTREPDWNPKARRVEKLTDGPIGLGTRYEAEFLKDSPTTIEFVRYERPVAWESVGRSRRLDAKAEGRVSRWRTAHASSCGWS
jgi:Polyketide cyclase / dehydrase and lipid transport